MLTVCGTQPYTRSHSQRANFCRMLNGVPCAPTSHNYHILYAQVHRNNATITTAKTKKTNHNIFIMIRFSRFLFSLSLSQFSWKFFFISISPRYNECCNFRIECQQSKQLNTQYYGLYASERFNVCYFV